MTKKTDNLTLAERDEGRRLLALINNASNPYTYGNPDIRVKLEFIFWKHADALLADQNNVAAALLAKMRSKQAICEQSNLGPEAAWWAEAQRLLGEAVKSCGGTLDGIDQ